MWKMGFEEVKEATVGHERKYNQNPGCGVPAPMLKWSDTVSDEEYCDESVSRPESESNEADEGRLKRIRWTRETKINEEDRRQKGGVRGKYASEERCYWKDEVGEGARWCQRHPSRYSSQRSRWLS